MKAISIHQPFAAAILSGAKTREHRSWRTDYRGPLLIHAADTTASLGDLAPSDFYFRAILGVVDLVDCQPHGQGFAWILANPRPVDPINHRGRQGLFNVDVGELASRFPDVSWLVELDQSANALPSPK